MPVGFTDLISDPVAGFETGPRGLLPGRPTVILIHGSGGSRLAWRAQVRPLDRTMNVLAVDLPGHGDTPGPPLKNIGGLAGWVAGLIDGLNPPRPLVLAGASLGGAVAVEIALTRKNLPDALVLVSTTPFIQVDPELLHALETDYPAGLAMFTDTLFSSGADEAAVRQSRNILAGQAPDIITSDLRAGHGFDRRADLGRIDLPVLVLCGQEDTMTPPEHSRFLADHIPGARLFMFEGAGHMLVVERHREVNQAITEFILGLPTVSGRGPSV